jgi:hypothetical protein
VKMQRAAGAPMSFSPLKLSDVARRRATRADGWPVREGSPERSEGEGPREGQDPSDRAAWAAEGTP